MAKILDLPIHDRPIEKILSGKIESLTHSELLAVIIGSGTRGKNVLELSQLLLSNYGSLKSLAKTSIRELTKIPGIKNIKGARLLAALQLAKYILDEGPNPKLDTHEAVYHFIKPKFSNAREEQLHLLLLDHSLHLTEHHLFAHGTHNEIPVFLKDLMGFLLRTGAPNIILVHNHFEKIPLPSQEDRDLTTALQMRCALFDITLLCHMVIGSEGYSIINDDK